MKTMENKYQVKYIIRNDELFAQLIINDKLEHEINADHIIWEHFYNNKWID